MVVQVIKLSYPSLVNSSTIQPSLSEGYTRCIRVLAIEIFPKISVASMRTLGRGEETLLSSGWTLIGSELSSPNFN